LLLGEAWTPYLAALDRLASRSDRPVHWLPFHHDQDGPLLHSLRSQGLLPPGLDARSQLVAAGDPAAALDHFAGASLVIAMRLHGLILAALAGAPTAALSYDPKVAAAAAAIGCPCQELTSPGDPDLAERWLQQMEQPTPTDRIAALRAGAERHRPVLEQVVTAAGLQPDPKTRQG
jgi:polysaccharide pyruvyl transferase WcaK-like protein